MREQHRVAGTLRGTSRLHTRCWRAAALVVVLTARAVAAQYELDPRGIIDGGGTASGGTFVVTGTLGRIDAGYLSEGGLSIYGGFWPSRPSLRICSGDCTGDGAVTVDELVTMTNIALGLTPLSGCPAGDANGDAQITIDDLLVAVTHALGGCPEARGVVGGTDASDGGKLP